MHPRLAHRLITNRLQRSAEEMEIAAQVGDDLAARHIRWRESTSREFFAPKSTDPVTE